MSVNINNIRSKRAVVRENLSPILNTRLSPQEENNMNVAFIDDTGVLYRKAINDSFKDSNVQINNIGPMNQTCEFCQSINFKCDRTTDSKISICCMKGKIKNYNHSKIVRLPEKIFSRVNFTFNLKITVNILL